MAFQKNKSLPKKEDFSNLKNSVIRFRVTKQEKREIKESATAQGFDTVSAFILSLYRQAPTVQK